MIQLINQKVICMFNVSIEGSEHIIIMIPENQASALLTSQLCHHHSTITTLTPANEAECSAQAIARTLLVTDGLIM